MFEGIPVFYVLIAVGSFFTLFILAPWLLGVRYIPHNRVGIVEKLWSASGSLSEGRIIALNGEAGYQSDVLRGGLHFGYFPWQYSIHKQPLVLVGESKIGYVYARDGEPLAPIQTLGRTVNCNSFQDSRVFIDGHGQRGRQRGILREGLYAINLALFVVVTEDRVYGGPMSDSSDTKYVDWQTQLRRIGGFSPVLVGAVKGNAPSAMHEQAFAEGTGEVLDHDPIGVVTVHDGQSIESGEIIAPEVLADDTERGHNNFQDPEAFLRMAGRRGKQLQVLTDGTYFINRWFGTVELLPKTLVPIGYVGVVVSYHGEKGDDITGTGFRYGEQVEPGKRGVWKRALPPGKYPLNPYALKLELVPTVNFVLRWITGQVEAHRYDQDLRSIELITADGYEPVLPLSLVLHIDYEKAPSVIQRFGDVKRLISQTLDPILSAYFRDVAQGRHMLDLLTKRDEIQKIATDELGRRFKEYDINCIAVLIGRPDSPGEKEDPIDKLFDQLRMRRLAEEQLETFARQEDAAKKLRELNDAKAAADKQSELTQTKIGIEIAGNKGQAQLAEAQQMAKRDVALAEGEARRKVLMAESESRQRVLVAEGEAKSKELLGQGEGRAKELIGHGEASRIAQTGLAEASVSLQKIRAYGDPRLYALNALGKYFSRSVQPLVPERIFVTGTQHNGGENGKDGGGGGGMGPVPNVLGPFLSLLLAEKTGFDVAGNKESLADLENFARDIAKTNKEDHREANRLREAQLSVKESVRNNGTK